MFSSFFCISCLHLTTFLGQVASPDNRNIFAAFVSNLIASRIIGHSYIVVYVCAVFGFFFSPFLYCVCVFFSLELISIFRNRKSFTVCGLPFNVSFYDDKRWLRLSQWQWMRENDRQVNKRGPDKFIILNGSSEIRWQFVFLQYIHSSCYYTKFSSNVVCVCVPAKLFMHINFQAFLASVVRLLSHFFLFLLLDLYFLSPFWLDNFLLLLFSYLIK